MGIHYSGNHKDETPAVHPLPIRGSGRFTRKGLVPMASISSPQRHDFVVELVGRHTGATTTEWDALTDGEVLANVQSWASAGMRVTLVTRVDGVVYYRDEAAA